MQIIDGGFLHSEHWEKFQRSLGRKVFRIGDGQNNALMIKHKLPLAGGYFFVPRGPIIQLPTSNFQFLKFVEEIVKTAKKNKAGWVRVEPQSVDDLNLIRRACRQLHLTTEKSKKNHEPAQTLMLDLEKTQEQLLAGMKPKTRYNIRLAQKRGVRIAVSRKPEDINIFCDLTKETAERDGIISHPMTYYQKMLEVVGDDFLKLYLASYQDKVIAANLVSFYGEVATYWHGASSNNNRNVMAPYLLQWQSILDAKKAGCRKYDFGGTKIAKSASFVEAAKKVKNKNLDSSWQGITRFKSGFCPDGGVVEFPGCYDIIISKRKHILYKILQAIKDILLRF